MNFKDHIHSYLNGTLNEDELILFEKKMNANPKFKEEVKLQKFIIETTVSKAILKQEVKDIARKRKQRKKWIRIISFISFFFLLIILFFYFSNSFVSNDSKDKIAHNDLLKIDHPKLSFVHKGDIDSTLKNSIMDSISNYYNKGNYQNTILLIDSLIILSEPHSTDIEILMTKGKSQYELSEFKNAISTFDKIIDKGSENKKIYAMYYGALARIQTNKPDEAIVLLNAITNNIESKQLNFEYHQDIKVLLQKYR